MPNTHKQHDLALYVVETLRKQGYEALWAGGCVRDQLLGCQPDDYDVATNARPEQVRELFGKRRTLAIGAAFGVIAVMGKHGQPPVEVATFRSDGAYVDGRRPEEVIFTTAEEDAARRDFTINGMFYDPIAKRVIDYVGGQEDLEQGVIRAIGDPKARFSEDKLRMLRAVRFATTLDFQIEAETQQAVLQMAAEVKVVSAERIGVEIRRMLVHSQRSRGAQLLEQSGLLAALLPELAELHAEDSEAKKRFYGRLEELETDTLPAALAALLIDVDLQLTTEIGTRFRFTNKEIERTDWILKTIDQIDCADRLPWPRLQRILIHDGISELLALATALWGEGHEGVRECHRRLNLPIEELNPQPLVTGKELLEAGFTAGPSLGKLLEHLRDEQLLGNIESPEQALALAGKWQDQDMAQ